MNNNARLSHTAPAFSKTSTVIKRVVKVLSDSLSRSPDKAASQNIIAAVSGGPDSLALLFGLIALQKERFFSLKVAHFGHGIRPVEETGEASLVEAIAAKHAIQVIHGRADVLEYASYAKLSIEAAARNLRYEFLAQTSANFGDAIIALGHTLEDQAETVLLRIIRGTGLRGLSGMREWSKRNVPGENTVELWRPLLQTSHSELEAVCAEHAAVPAMDHSNLSVDFSRNRIRLKVIPELKAINPSVFQALNRLSDIAQEENEFLQSFVHPVQQNYDASGSGRIHWESKFLLEMAEPVLARSLQLAWQSLCGEGATLSRSHINSVSALLKTRTSGQITLPRGMSFFLQSNNCYLGMPLIATERLGRETRLSVPMKRRIASWLVDVTAFPICSGLTFSPWEACLDADLIGDNLILRSRKRSDKFHPLGLEHMKKLQDFFVDAKVAVNDRDKIPLLVTSKGIAWVGGQRVAQWASITPRTKNVLKVSFKTLDR